MIKLIDAPNSNEMSWNFQNNLKLKFLDRVMSLCINY